VVAGASNLPNGQRLVVGHVVDAACSIVQREFNGLRDVRMMNQVREGLGLAGNALFYVPPRVAKSLSMSASNESMEV